MITKVCFQIIRAANNGDADEQSTGRLSTVTDQRLNGQTAWFGVCDPAVASAVEVVSLEGAPPGGLRFERRKTRADGIDFLIGADCVVVATNWKAIARNAGT